MSVPRSEDGFHELEHTGWERAAVQYRDWWGALTTQSVVPLLDAAGVAAGARVLDVASGPGYAAGEAAARGAESVGIDFSIAMVGEARRRFPRARFEEGDAEELPFQPGTFDAVVCNYGLLHLADPDHAIAEAFRVLRAGGRYAFTVWATPDAAVAFDLVLRAIERHGDINVPLPQGPAFFRFSDAAEARRALETAGFRNTDVERVVQTWRLPGPEALFQAMATGTVRTAALLGAQTPRALASIRTDVAKGAQQYTVDAVIALPMPAVLSSGVKPVQQ